MLRGKFKYILFAFIAALFYALNIPLAKLLLGKTGSTVLAGLLYLGAGIGIGILFLCKKKKIPKSERLDRKDFPYVILMVLLDIAAPILLMHGLKTTAAGNASLLNNFEIVATTVIAFIFFHEKISFKMWLALLFVTASGIILGIGDISFDFSFGSLYILGATVCWGVENNCTRKLSVKSSLEIVTVKGVCCGLSSLFIGFAIGERVSGISDVLFALCLGFVAYGLSIYFYIRAQSGIGAAKTGAFYAVNPFIATLISFLIFKDVPDVSYWIGLATMTVGTLFIVWDTLSGKKT